MYFNSIIYTTFKPVHYLPSNDGVACPCNVISPWINKIQLNGSEFVQEKQFICKTIRIERKELIYFYYLGNKIVIQEPRNQFSHMLTFLYLLGSNKKCWLFFCNMEQFYGCVFMAFYHDPWQQFSAAVRKSKIETNGSEQNSKPDQQPIIHDSTA